MNSQRAIAVFLAAITLLLCAVVGLLAWPYLHQGSLRFETEYQAVLLTGGQVYYGRLEGMGTPYPVLRDVYYVKSQADPQTKQVTSILVRRGQEWHAPDRMYLNPGHIILVEPVGPNSKVAQLIAETKK